MKKHNTKPIAIDCNAIAIIRVDTCIWPNRKYWAICEDGAMDEADGGTCVKLDVSSFAVGTTIEVREPNHLARGEYIRTRENWQRLKNGNVRVVTYFDPRVTGGAK